MKPVMIRAARPVLIAATVGMVVWVNAGSLTPPGGPVAPTMKTLDEVEARIPVQSLPGSATAVHVISQPGSYYLTGNINGVAGKHGIEVITDDVAIDLNGYALIGGTGTLDGVNIESVPSVQNVEVFNGIIRDWEEEGIAGSLGGSGGVFRNLRLANNLESGISATRAVITDCVIQDNGLYGILVYESRVFNCTVVANGTGIAAYFGSTVESCTGKLNSYHIDIGSGSTARNNNFQSAFVTGIYVRENCRVVGNLIDGSSFEGILIENSANSVGNLIEDNLLTNCDIGIDAGQPDVSGNLIIRNRAHNNNIDFDMGSGNTYGPVVNVGGAGDISTSGAAGQDHPMANYRF